MPDAPDFYQYWTIGERAAMFDMGELAARLGSPSLYHRGGITVYQTDFRRGYGEWLTGGSGGTPTFGLYAGHSLNSGYVLKMQTGGSGLNTAVLNMGLPALEATSMGIEVGVRFPLQFADFTIELLREIGSTQHRGLLRLDEDNNQVQYGPSTGGLATIISGWSSTGTAPRTTYAKLIVEWEADEYEQILVDNEAVNLDGEGLRDTGTGTNDPHEIVLTLGGRDGQQDYCYIDHIIITLAEPEAEAS